MNNNLPVGGPHYLVTPTILDILKEKKVKATFFITGGNVRHNNLLLLGDILCLTYLHASLSYAWIPVTLAVSFNIIHQPFIHSPMYPLPLQGLKAMYHRNLLHRMHSEGHELASHGFHAVLFTDLSFEDISRNLLRTSGIISNVTNSQVKYFRPPKGKSCIDDEGEMSKEGEKW